jgi:transketolase
MMDKELENFSRKIRIHVLNMVMNAQSSHIGSSFSIVEILTVLYKVILNVNPKHIDDPNRDKFLLSKAHGSTSLYGVLAELGFFPLSHLEKYYINDGILPGHLDQQTIGIEFSFGSLGHGLSVGLGMAISNNQMNNPGKIYVLMGDGECNEGSVWEAIMLASHLKLSNITAIVDYNKIQSFGNTNEVINQEPMNERWKSFGWDVIEINGHSFEELVGAFEVISTKPKVIIAHTIKGKGVSFMENSLDWHYKSPNDEQYEMALKEISEK